MNVEELEAENERLQKRIEKLENHLQICRLGLIHAGRFYPSPQQDSFRGLFFNVAQTVHASLQMLFEAGGLSQEAYDSTRSPRVAPQQNVAADAKRG